MKEIWQEMKTNGLSLTPAEDITWTSQLQRRDDFALMDFISSKYSKPLATQLNRYHLYLQLITFYNTITYDGTQIHPNIINGQPIKSRLSLLYWVQFTKPL